MTLFSLSTIVVFEQLLYGRLGIVYIVSDINSNCVPFTPHFYWCFSLFSQLILPRRHPKKNNPLTKHPAEEMPFNSKNVCLFTFFSHEMLPFIVDRYSLLNGAPSLLSIDNSQRFFLSLLVCSQIKPPTSNGHQFWLAYRSHFHLQKYVWFSSFFWVFLSFFITLKV